MSEEQLAKIQEVNSVQIRSFFAHHPNCNQYDHHVFKVGKWRFCLGCTAMYSAFSIFFIVDIIIFSTFSISPFTRYVLGVIFFLPALFQLVWKSHKKFIKFMMRFTLGISIWFLLSGIFYTENIYLKILNTLVFIAAAWIYSNRQAGKQLIECTTCNYNQHYDTCLIKFSDILKIHDLELIKDESPVIAHLLDLKKRAEFNEAIILPKFDK